MFREIVADIAIDLCPNCFSNRIKIENRNIDIF
jgi:hypothetical protein